ncbi:tyrosine-type recombinase/integrase [Granulicatella adiacens]
MASIYKRGKTWSYKVYYYDNGKQKAVSKSGFKTKAEAKDASVIRENEMLQGKNFSKERTFLADYMENWRKLYKENVISPKTLQQIRIVTNYVRKSYNLMLKDITHENYQEFLNKVAENHAKETVKKYHTYVKAALKYAIRTNILSVNPAEGAILKGVDSKTKKEELKFLSLDEFKALEEALVKDIRADYTTRYIILFSMYTGARFGESLGLTWDCVDFENEKIKIEKGFDYQFTNDFTEGKTKSSKRTIDVSQKILTLLDELPRNKNVVFERVSNNAVNKSLQKALLRAGIKKKVTFHALRHTHASILLSKGVQLLTVSKRLGHADPNITLQTYAHILDEMKDSESDKIKQIF